MKVCQMYMKMKMEANLTGNTFNMNVQINVSYLAS